MIVQLIKPRLAVAFAWSEHCCAFGYAMTEFAVAHAHLVLWIASALLIASICALVLCTVTEHCGALNFNRKGYRYDV